MNRTDEPFFRQLLNLICDILLCNVYFLVCSLPVVTMGAAFSGLYRAMLRLTRGEGSVTKDFFAGFRSDFWRSTLIWLLLLAVGLGVWADYYFVLAVSGGSTLVTVLLCVIAFWVAATGTYAFPLLAQFSNKTGRTLRNAMLLSVTNFPRTLLMAAMSAAIWLVAVFRTEWLYRLAILWLFGGFSVPAYFNSLLLKKIFQPFLEKPAEKPAEKAE